MPKKLVRLTEGDLHKIIKESVNKVLKEVDRHREGYYKERWAKQKAAKQSNREKDADTSEKPQKQTSKSKKDRHRKGYYHNYNQTHLERLNRGFTKGYNNGNVSDGVKEKQNGNIWYDNLGRPHSNDFFNPTLSDLLDYKCNVEWHDDDWCEGSWDD